jgi:hypothetical protein
MDPFVLERRVHGYAIRCGMRKTFGNRHRDAWTLAEWPKPRVPSINRSTHEFLVLGCRVLRGLKRIYVDHLGASRAPISYRGLRARSPTQGR